MAYNSKKQRARLSSRRVNLKIEKLEDRHLFSISTLSPPPLEHMLAAPPLEHMLMSAPVDDSGTPTVGAGAISFEATAVSGLVAAWGFDSTSGNTAADASGNSLNGTVSGATWVTSGKYGGALSFDGVNDWVTVNDNNLLELSAGMTLEAWVYPTSSSGVRDILIKEGSGVDIFNLYHRNGNGLPESNAFINGSNRTAQGSALPLNTWSHIAGTYDGTALRLYVNGTLAASTNISGSIATSTGPLRIGGNSLWGEFFAGRIDEVRIYDRALTQTEIQVDMATAVGNSTPPPLNSNWTPFVYAGANQTVQIADGAAVVGEVIANIPSGLSMNWSLVSGPGTANFANPNALSTSVAFSTSGTYELRFTATNHGVSASDVVVVNVQSSNQDEVIATNNPLTLAEGATGTITSTLLRTTDTDNTASQLTYTVTAGPTRGTLRKSGTATTFFTQADINAGIITYQHNGSETTTDSFTFRVNDLEGAGTTATFNINVTPVNDEQVLSTNSPLSVTSGGTATVTSSQLTTTDPDNTPSQLTYTVTTGPTRGTLRKSGSATTSFTQADVNAGLITYQHNGSQTTSDSFSFSVNDGQGTSTSATFNITVGQSTAGLPQLPAQLNTTLDPSYNRPADIFVAAGGNLQAAINSAQAGQIIELQAGATFTGNFTLPNKSGNGWIYIRTSDYANLPAPGTRVGPADANHMAKLRSTNRNSLVITNANAHNIRFIGIEFENTYAATDVTYNIVRLENGANNIFFDRVYIHGSTTGNTYDGISASSVGSFAVIDSHISEIHVAQNQAESHGIYMRESSGPVLIQNNYIAAAGENILTGGAGIDTSHPGTTDLTIRGNHLHKPLSWKNPIASGPNAGLVWKVKNLFELKEGTRVLFEGNLLENNWAQSQVGFGIVFTPYDDVITDVTLRKNVLWNSEQGFNLSETASGLNNILIEDNIVYSPTGNYRFFLQINSGINNLQIRHNTFAGANMTLLRHEAGNPAVNGMIAKDNIFFNTGYGILGNGTSEGLNTIQNYQDSYDWNNNVSIGTFHTYGTDSGFRGWLYANGVGNVGFVDSAFNDIDDFRLAASSPYRNAGTDGKDIGADVNALLGVISSQSGGAQLSFSGFSDEHSGAIAASTLTAPLAAPLGSSSLNSPTLRSTTPADPALPANVVDVDLLASIGSSTNMGGGGSAMSSTLFIDEANGTSRPPEITIDSEITDILFGIDWEELLFSEDWESLARTLR